MRSLFLSLDRISHSSMNVRHSSVPLQRDAMALASKLMAAQYDGHTFPTLRPKGSMLMMLKIAPI